MESSPQLQRRLGLFDACAIVVGIVIGSGIFLVPNLIATALPSPAWILAAWLVTGGLSFLGALAFAELGAMLPSTGGQYIYLREAWGRLPAFLCGWTHFLVSQSGSIAFLSVSFAIYLSYFVPLGAWQAKGAALAAMAVLTVVNYRGLRPGAAVQNACTVAKIAGLALIVVGALLFAPRMNAKPTFDSFVSLSGFGVAMIACLLCYDGWSAVSFVAGEVKRPERTLVRALAGGLGLVIVVYVLANIAYLRVLAVPEITGAGRVGSLAAQRIFGHPGAVVVSATIVLSILGSLNGRLLTQPRVYFAQARDGLFFRRFGDVHPRFHTPAFSIAAQGAWSAVLILTSSYEVLVDYRMIAVWVLDGATVAGLIALRRRQPHWRRPFRMWGYPATPLLFVAVELALVANTLVQRPHTSFASLGLMAAGVPVYYFWRRRTS